MPPLMSCNVHLCFHGSMPHFWPVCSIVIIMLSRKDTHTIYNYLSVFSTPPPYPLITLRVIRLIHINLFIIVIIVIQSLIYSGLRAEFFHIYCSE